MLRLKAKEFCDDPAFKASVGWYINWKRRHSITPRTKTTLAQRLPNDLKEQTVKFHQFVIAARQRRGYPLSRIFNMDETPMRFEMPSSRTLEFSGSRTVPMKSCGTEKRRKKRRSKLDKAVLEGDPGGDGDGTEDDAIYEEEQDNDAEEDEMDEEFDTESEDEP